MAGPFAVETPVSGSASELARRLAREAEAVCRRYLSNGRRQGGYWIAGEVRNTPGRSMFVRLKETAKGSAGKWTDYVALQVMLRICDCAPSCRRVTVFQQHNFSALREVA